MPVLASSCHCMCDDARCLATPTLDIGHNFWLAGCSIAKDQMRLLAIDLRATRCAVQLLSIKSRSWNQKPASGAFDDVLEVHISAIRCSCCPSNRVKSEATWAFYDVSGFHVSAIRCSCCSPDRVGSEATGAFYSVPEVDVSSSWQPA